jgi:hypothetical protein
VLAEINTQTLVDIEAIKNLKARYGQYVDDAVSHYTPERLQRLGEIFSADVEADFGLPTGPLKGPLAIQDFIGTVRTKRSWMWHSFHSPLIEIEHDHAVGHWTIYCLATQDASGQVDIIVGRYRDEYVRTPQGWRQSRLTFSNETRNPSGSSPQKQ